MDIPLKLCYKCKNNLPLNNFRPRKLSNPSYLRAECKKCVDRQSVFRKRKYVSNPKNRAQCIVNDSRNCDKKHNRENNLTKEFVQSKLDEGSCFYCGDAQIMLTLDRIDNDKGHVTDNVITACIRCNEIRKNMPYQAWEFIAPNIRQARQQGLFGTWTGNNNRGAKRKLF